LSAMSSGTGGVGICALQVYHRSLPSQNNTIILQIGLLILGGHLLIRLCKKRTLA
jgi:hypothetical protein